MFTLIDRCGSTRLQQDSSGNALNSFGAVRKLSSLLGFALGGHGLHGLLDGFLVAEEGHGFDGLQVGVQLVHDGDSGRKVQLHDGSVGHSCTHR